MSQLDLFASARNELSIPQAPDIASIRRRLGEVLDLVRTVDALPWEPHQLRSWQHVFHNMANWLPPAERDRLREQFTAELARLLHT